MPKAPFDLRVAAKLHGASTVAAVAPVATLPGVLYEIDRIEKLDREGSFTNSARLAVMSLNSSCLPGQLSLKLRTQNSGVRSEWTKSSRNVRASFDNSSLELFRCT